MKCAKAHTKEKQGAMFVEDPGICHQRTSDEREYEENMPNPVAENNSGRIDAVFNVVIFVLNFVGSIDNRWNSRGSTYCKSA